MKTAQHAYTKAAADISSMVWDLQKYADQMHNLEANKINWAHANDMERVKAALSESLDLIKQVHQSHA